MGAQVPLLGRFELRTTFVSMKVFIGDRGHPSFARKVVGSFAHEHDVQSFFHDTPRQLHRVLNASDTRDCTSFLIATIHDRSIQLRRAVSRQSCPTACIE